MRSSRRRLARCIGLRLRRRHRHAALRYGDRLRRDPHDARTNPAVGRRHSTFKKTFCASSRNALKAGKGGNRSRSRPGTQQPGAKPCAAKSVPDRPADGGESTLHSCSACRPIKSTDLLAIRAENLDSSSPGFCCRRHSGRSAAATARCTACRTAGGRPSRANRHRGDRLVSGDHRLGHPRLAGPKPVRFVSTRFVQQQRWTVVSMESAELRPHSEQRPAARCPVPSVGHRLSEHRAAGRLGSGEWNRHFRASTRPGRRSGRAWTTAWFALQVIVAQYRAGLGGIDFNRYATIQQNLDRSAGPMGPSSWPDLSWSDSGLPRPGRRLADQMLATARTN